MALFDRLASLGDGIATRKRRWIGLLQSSASPLADGTHAEEGEGQTLPEGVGAGEGERQGSGPIASGKSTKDVFLGTTVDLGRPSERQRLDKIRWLIASEQVLPHGDGRMGIVRMNVDGLVTKHLPHPITYNSPPRGETRRTSHWVPPLRCQQGVPWRYCLGPTPMATLARTQG